MTSGKQARGGATHTPGDDLADGVVPAPVSKPTSEPDYSKHPEKPIWDKWQREGGRCPYCVGTDDRDWLGMCDCWEAERVLIDKGPEPDVK